MIRRKGICFYLPQELVDQIKWRNRSEFVEIGVLYLLNQLKTDKNLRDTMIQLRELRRNRD